MTTPSKKPSLSWATFLVPVRISTRDTVVPAIVASETTHLSLDTFAGQTVLLIEDAGIGEPIRVPWGAVGSFGVKT